MAAAYGAGLSGRHLIAGNPIAMAAGYTCLREVAAKPGVYKQLAQQTERLAYGLLSATESTGVLLVVNRVGGMFDLFFTDLSRVTSFQDVQMCDVERFKRFFHAMLLVWFYLVPSAYEASFMSLAHGDVEIRLTLEAALHSVSLGCNRFARGLGLRNFSAALPCGRSRKQHRPECGHLFSDTAFSVDAALAIVTT